MKLDSLPRTILEALSVGYFTLTRDGAIAFANYFIHYTDLTTLHL